MVTETVKKPRKKIIKPLPKEAVPKIVNKHLKKVARLGKLEFLPFLSINTDNKDAFSKFNTVAEVGEFLDKHAMMYFDIPSQDCEGANAIEFPETSREFLDLFFILQKRYQTKVVNQDITVGSNKYRSLGEIYLTFKFYYSKITWKLFLRTLFEKFSETTLASIAASKSADLIADVSPTDLSTLKCSTIKRRVFSIKAITGRALGTCSQMNSPDEFGFVLKDYLDYCK
jgi:hypothetical protein